jgi:hypothetical protein
VLEHRIKAVARAFYWQRLLDTGRVADSTELARREKLDKTFVNETLRFALLAPRSNLGLKMAA